MTKAKPVVVKPTVIRISDKEVEVDGILYRRVTELKVGSYYRCDNNASYDCYEGDIVVVLRPDSVYSISRTEFISFVHFKDEIDRYWTEIKFEDLYENLG